MTINDGYTSNVGPPTRQLTWFTTRLTVICCRQKCTKLHGIIDQLVTRGPHFLNMYRQIHTYIHIYIYVHTSVYNCIYIYMYMYVYVCIHFIYIYRHIWNCSIWVYDWRLFEVMYEYATLPLCHFMHEFLWKILQPSIPQWLYYTIDGMCNSRGRPSLRY